ncbi:Fe-S cluster assembly protein SufD [Thermomonas haemolytica]|uniref:Iron-regulated ABC transporter permease protein SufD n=1 Tax=Thermomonas haemolytica TaxID=141949 RepID=A0A4R3NG13_9GAMM|nr:Fe-S cluster assembly protein SufD [Thermomonas haemolytica]TCT26179.1 iron-regulated ABC transporter permease protein SufD [Thermomonas haemolytica]TNY29982.1 Fe-S cluster assembly protein SufD [Thermomonas haemolytica]
MSALLDSLAAGFDGDADRRAQLDALLHDGLPARAEAWKYTSLRALERRRFGAAQAVAVDPAHLADIPAPRLVFVNGHFDATLSDLSGLPAGVDVQPLSQLLQGDDARAVNFLARRYARADEPFARLNAALAREGAVVRVEAGVEVQAPLHIVSVGAPQDGDAAWHLRHFVELRAGATLQLVEHELAAGEHAHLGNMLLHAHVAKTARLAHVRVQHAAVRASLFARTDAVLARSAEYLRTDLELGAALSRNELNVRLEGEGARLRADGALLADGRRHVDTRLGIDHIARDTACSLTWRGLADQRGRAVFHGGITIHPGADGTEAALSNKNLLLSADAEIDTQPVLVIHADEVKAAHGAAVGQLDPDALFYLRARGIPEARARTLLTAAFCREVLAGIADAPTRALTEAALERALERLGA